jgi:microcompartment protein CcmL/EutN
VECPAWPRLNAFGVIETFTVASTLLAADAAAKATPVTLVEIRLAVGIGGKSFVTMVGEVGDVEASVDAGVATIEPRTLRVRSVVIPNPHPDLEPYILWGGDVPGKSDRNGGVHAEVPGT